jgi:hypothetical protein
MSSRKPDTGQLPYREITDESYARKAAPTFGIEEPKPGLRILRGSCPRCGAIIDIPLMPSVFGGNRSSSTVLRPGATSKGDAGSIEPVLCTCDDDHPGRPDGRRGCGAYWNFVIHPASA